MCQLVGRLLSKYILKRTGISTCIRERDITCILKKNYFKISDIAFVLRELTDTILI